MAKTKKRTFTLPIGSDEDAIQLNKKLDNLLAVMSKDTKVKKTVLVRTLITEAMKDEKNVRKLVQSDSLLQEIAEHKQSIADKQDALNRCETALAKLQ